METGIEVWRRLGLVIAAFVDNLKGVPEMHGFCLKTTATFV